MEVFNSALIPSYYPISHTQLATEQTKLIYNFQVNIKKDKIYLFPHTAYVSNVKLVITFYGLFTYNSHITYFLMSIKQASNNQNIWTL